IRGVRMKITCPESTCRAENDAHASACEQCQTPLRGYAQMLMHPARLFNKGLSKARENKFAQARELFAAVVYWCPMDLEARNALAMACYAQNDPDQARYHWEWILAQSPADTLAKQGLASLQPRSFWKGISQSVPKRPDP